MNFKEINQLKSELIDWEYDAVTAIAIELKRIARPVKFSELTYIPFNQEVSIYLDTIYLNQNLEPVLDTSFADVDCKELRGFMSDSEIDSWGLLGLLGLLQDIDS